MRIPTLRSLLRSPRALFGAGSLFTLLAVSALAPFNMGGCSPEQIITGITSGGKVIQANSVNANDDLNLGQSVLINATGRYGIVHDDKLQTYVDLVGMTVASASTDSKTFFYFGVLDTDEVNAFSGPGGYVLITRGALAHMRDESELAGVLAHEIGHICMNHGRDAVKQKMTETAALSALSAADQKFAQYSEAGDFLGNTILNVGFSQPQEYQADDQAVQFLAKAGYDPNGYLNFLKRIKVEKGPNGGNLMSTHPGLDERITRVTNQIQQLGPQARHATLAERYQANVPMHMQ